MPIGEAVEGQLGPFDEVAVLMVSRVCNWLTSALPSTLKASGSTLFRSTASCCQKPLQFQADERRDVGLGHADRCRGY